jgi:hypothetical protein
MKTFHLHVNISYMNSSSTKCILDILDLLAKSYESGSAVSVTWYYDRRMNGHWISQKSLRKMQRSRLR